MTDRKVNIGLDECPEYVPLDWLQRRLASQGLHVVTDKAKAALDAIYDARSDSGEPLWLEFFPVSLEEADSFNAYIEERQATEPLAPRLDTLGKRNARHE